MSDAAGAVQQLAAAAANFKSAVAKVVLPKKPVSEAPPTAAVLEGVATTLQQYQARLTSAVAEAAGAESATRASLTTGKASLDGLLAKEELAFNHAINALPAMKGKTIAQLSSEYGRLASDIGKLTPLEGTLAGLKEHILALSQERAALLGHLSDLRNARWTALTQAVKSLNKRLEGQLRIEFEPERTRDPLIEFLLECDLDR